MNEKGKRAVTFTMSRDDADNLCFALGGAMGSLFRCNVATGDFAREDWEATRDDIETATNIVMRALGGYTYDVSGRNAVERGAAPPPEPPEADPYELVRSARKARE